MSYAQVFICSNCGEVINIYIYDFGYYKIYEQPICFVCGEQCSPKIIDGHKVYRSLTEE